MKLRTIFIIAALASLLGVRAQKLTVESMTVAGNDISGSRYERKDLAGIPCALVKVQLASPGAEFEGNVLGGVDYKTGEYWVYMSQGSRELRIKHPQTQPLHVLFSNYGIKKVDSKVTYNLSVLLPQTMTSPKEQKLTINYSPADALVLIDSKPHKGNGSIEVKLPVGSHQYQIVALGYETAEGTVKLTANAPRTITEHLVATEETAASTTLAQSAATFSTKNAEKEVEFTWYGVDFTLYGMKLHISFDARNRVRVPNCDEEQIVKCIEWLTNATSKTLNECLRLKERYRLCDWAYMQLLDHLSEKCLGKTNEGTIMMGLMLSKSGYNVVLHRNEQSNKILLCYHTEALVYNQMCYTFNGKKLYLYGNYKESEADNTLKAVHLNDHGKPVNLRYIGQQNFPMQSTKPRTVKSAKNADFTFTFSVNKNLIDFYSGYPAFCYGDNFMTRWEAIANQPLEEHLQNTLIKDMKEKVRGMSPQQAVQQILWWVQGKGEKKGTDDDTGYFTWGYDEEIWNRDYAFYAEETLYYPYNDSEDRSILFSRLVRDVLGLDVLLVYYPGHLATAVCFNDSSIAGGDSITYNNRSFMICDPTYIGARIGQVIPDMKGKKETVILLER